MHPRNAVVNRDTGFNDIVAEMEKLAHSYVKVGFLEGEQTKQQTKQNPLTGQARHKEGGKSQVQIAFDNEFGTQRIPSRSFMRTSYDENIARINRALEGEYNKIVAGTSTVTRSLNAIGVYMTGLIQQKIRAIHFPPNSPRTIREKGSSKPLIDFGQMISAVHHVVVVA